MDIIQYQTKLKADGDTYKKIVFWNRFIKKPTELILTIAPAIIATVMLAMGYISTFIAVIYAVCYFYPIYIFFVQFKSAVNYHLKNRPKSESAPCLMTITTDMITAQIDLDNEQSIENYDWNDFTTIYFKQGYYLMFDKSKMLVMFNSQDMSQEQREAFPDLIKRSVDLNKCKLAF